MDIETLIELFDERPLENVLGVEIFRPRQVVYICPHNAAQNETLHRKLRDFFAHRGQKVELIFHKADVYSASSVLALLRRIFAQYEGCALDITGGTDDVLFAAGQLSAEIDFPVFTFSRKKNCFYDIRSAPFAQERPCDLHYSVEDFFLMAGGSVRPGRVDNALLGDYLPIIDPFFRVYSENRRAWDRIVTYIQRLSPAGADGSYSLDAEGPVLAKGPRGSRIEVPEAALRSLQEIGLIEGLDVTAERVSFRFRDRQIRAWLRDVGSVLELYVYKACLDTEIFEDVRTSVIVDWESGVRENAVSNELDVMASRGVTPLFISCKTCDVKTEALNELAILRDRFGGFMARSAIVTAERAAPATRNRAAELGIRVIDWTDLRAGQLQKRLKNCMR